MLFFRYRSLNPTSVLCSSDVYTTSLNAEGAFALYGGFAIIVEVVYGTYRYGFITWCAKSDFYHGDMHLLNVNGSIFRVFFRFIISVFFMIQFLALSSCSFFFLEKICYYEKKHSRKSKNPIVRCVSELWGFSNFCTSLSGYQDSSHGQATFGISTFGNMSWISILFRYFLFLFFIYFFSEK